MKMAFSLFLIVFLITYNYGAARPLIDGEYTVINRWDEFVSDGKTFQIPTPIKLGTSIVINGTLDTNNKAFKVILGDNEGISENCKIDIHFKTGLITVTPTITDDQEIYEFDQLEGEQRFSLNVIARTNRKGEEILAIYFQANDKGDSSQLICDIKHIENINYIQMQEGVTHVDVLSFLFKEDSLETH